MLLAKPASNNDSQHTEIGTPEETNWDDSQNTQIQSQIDPGTPDLFCPVDELEQWAIINGSMGHKEGGNC
jgi:hypothetical protein